MNLNLTVDDRLAIVAEIWPNETNFYKTDDRCRAIAELERDPTRGTPTLSRVERERVEAEIEKRKAART